jgi:hypothetical protein
VNEATAHVRSDPRYDDPAMRDAYAEGMEWVCGYLGHRHRLGDERCVCGLTPAVSPTGTEVARVQDHYLELAADAYCAEHGHTDDAGMTGYSWRDGTCCCDYDVRAVLKAVGEVAGHVECRELLDRYQRQKDAAWDEVDRLRQLILRHHQAKTCEGWEFGKPPPEDVGSPADKRLWADLDGEVQS